MSSLSLMAAAAASSSSSSSMSMAIAADSRNCFKVSSIPSAKHSRFCSISMKRPPPNSPPPLGRLRAQAPGIAETFSDLKTQGKVAFIPYITAGDPDLATTAKALKLLSSCGADVIELGLPFNNPVMDGPVIQASSKRALANKTDTRAVVSMLKEVVPQISCPIVIFSYYNLILSQGNDRFLSSLEDAGVRGDILFDRKKLNPQKIIDRYFFFVLFRKYNVLCSSSNSECHFAGLIVPDLPLEESTSLKEEAAAKNIDMVFLTTPTTARAKTKLIADASEGFIYLVSSAGVTGARSTVNPQVEHLLKEIKKETTKPVAVGFGISKPDHVEQLSSWGADGVIVGSAIVKALGEAESEEEGLKQMECFVKSLVAALPAGKHDHHRILRTLEDDSHPPFLTRRHGDQGLRKTRPSQAPPRAYPKFNLLASQTPTQN